MLAHMDVQRVISVAITSVTNVIDETKAGMTDTNVTDETKAELADTNVIDEKNAEGGETTWTDRGDANGSVCYSGHCLFDSVTAALILAAG